MRVNWNDSSVEVYTVECWPSQLNQGDFLLFKGQLVRVETVQTGCPALSFYGRTFNHFVLRTRTNETLVTRELTGKVNAMRRKRASLQW